MRGVPGAQVCVSDISYTYPGSGTAALRKVSLTVERGDYVSILGSNGSGKSTLARCITGLMTPDTGSVVVTATGDVPTALVFQSPGDQLVAETVDLDVAFGPENLGVPYTEMHRQVPAALETFCLASLDNEKTASLSTGKKQLLALAGVHVLQSDVLILDEPTSMLSPLVRKELLDYLDQRNREGGTIIHITHDREEAERSQRILVMEDGAVVFDGTPESLMAVPEEQQELWGIHATFPERSAGHVTQDSIIECREICEGPLKDFSALFYRGSITAVTGESGSGKSTLLELLAGLRVPDDGSVIYTEESATALAVQESEASLFAEFVADDVAYGPRNAGICGKALVERVSSSMNAASLPFSEFKDRRTFSLSGGERRKAALAGIIAMDTPVILLDEPSSALDVRSRSQLLQLIVELAGRGKTVIFTTNREEECRIADAVITLPVPDIHPVIREKKKKLDRDQTTIDRLRRGEAGIYEKRSSMYHTLSPVAKYLCTIAAITATLVVTTIPGIAAVLLIEFGMVLLSRYPLPRLAHKLLVILPWIILIAVMQYFFSRGQQVNPVFLLRFIGLFLPLSVFVYTTSHTEIMYGVEDLFKPCAFFRFPVRDLSLLVGIVFRFIPLLYTEAGRITRARIIRKAGKKDTRGLFQALQSIATLFVPLVLRTLSRAERLAEAITARYYGAAKHTRYFSWKSGWKERFTVAITVLTFVALMYASILYERRIL